MRNLNEHLQEQTVYISNNVSIHFDGIDTFTVFDCNMAVDTFTHPDIIAMQHAKEVAERYIGRYYS